MKYVSIRCPHCNKRVAYVKVGTGEGICHTCGLVEKAEIDRQKKEQGITVSR
jgi:phage FluMu protein Com